MIEIDGSHGEGGGAILRTALALSLHTGKDFKITGIRANRPSPGLAAQHLAAIDAAAKLSNAEVNGNFLGSGAVYFKPGELRELFPGLKVISYEERRVDGEGDHPSYLASLVAQKL